MKLVTGEDRQGTSMRIEFEMGAKTLYLLQSRSVRLKMKYDNVY